MRQGSRPFQGTQVIPNNRGYTIVELIVVMAIFIFIIMIASFAFEQLITRSAQNTRSAESNIEGIVGFEQLRYDVEHAGYGLPWSFQEPTMLPPYEECDVAAGTPAVGVDSTSFNDVPPAVPRAILSGTSSKEVNGADGTNGGLGPDYLVVKSTMASIESTARKWSYVNYSSTGSYIKKWQTGDDLANNDRAITLNTGFSQTGASRQLVMNSAATGTAAAFYWTVSGDNPPASFQPGDSSQFFMAYGVASQNPKMPYNRADFFLHRPAGMPGRCNAGTGLLYKGVASHGGTGFTLFPLVDCVGDMQVEFELDPSSNGNTLLTDDLTGLTAADIRTQLKTVRVYFLSHEGRKDPNFNYPVTDAAKVLQVGHRDRATSGRIWSSANMESVFGPDWRNYRWKIYSMAVRPKNLN